MEWVFAILWIIVGAALSWGGERLVRRLRGEKDRTKALASENAAHLFRIKSLESEAALIPGLRAKIADLEARPPTIVEKPVVKMVERPFDNTATMTRLQSLEKEAARIPDLRARIAELEARPPKIVDRAVDNPAHLARITALEAEAAIIPDLQAKIAALEARAPEVVEKIVERPVDNPAHLARIRRLEEEVEVIPDLRARIAELERRPPEIVERPVEKIVERLADNPVHVARIRALEKEAGLVPSLRGRIAELEARASKFDMSAYGRPVERIIERLVPDLRASEESDRRLKELERRFEALERAIGRVNGAPEAAQLAGADADAPTAGLIDVAAARAEGFNMWGPDDLRIMSGLDDEAADILSAAGAATFAMIAEMTPAEIRQVLKSSRGAVEPSEAETWPKEAALVLRNDWRGLKALQQQQEAAGPS